MNSDSGATLFPLAPIHLVGLGTAQLAAVLLAIEPLWSIWPIGCFLLLALIAPVFPKWRLLMPVITRVDDQDSVVLTFDDGPDPKTTPLLLDLLKRHKAKAVFFLVGDKAKDNEQLVKKILDAGCEIGNHTMEHDVFISLKPLERLRASIDACQEQLQSLGIQPRLFRAPAWVLRPGLWRLLLERGMVCMDARVKSMDMGNRRIDGMAKRVLRKLRPGDVVSLHDTTPKNQDVESWLAEVEKILLGLDERKIGTRIFSISSQGRPTEAGLASEAVGTFYDYLAPDYDAEQTRDGQSSLRTAEHRVVQERLSKILSPAMTVLEVGAGTGRFTIPMARSAEKLCAMDLSAGMLFELEKKASKLGLHNIETVVGDIHETELNEKYDLICSFSAFEYSANFSKLLPSLSERLNEGGRILFTTAHAGLFRFFAQLGNAMRQGIWLHARTIPKTKRIMKDAGLQVEMISSFGPFGMLLMAQGLKPPSDT